MPPCSSCRTAGYIIDPRPTCLCAEKQSPTDLLAENRRLSDLAERYERQAVALNERLSKLSADLEAARAERDKWKAEGHLLAVAQKRIEELERTLRRKDPTEWSVLDAEYLKLKAERDAAEKRGDAFEATARGLGEECAALADQRDAAEAKLAQARACILGECSHELKGECAGALSPESKPEPVSNADKLPAPEAAKPTTKLQHCATHNTYRDPREEPCWGCERERIEAEADKVPGMCKTCKADCFCRTGDDCEGGTEWGDRCPECPDCGDESKSGDQGSWGVRHLRRHRHRSPRSEWRRRPCAVPELLEAEGVGAMSSKRIDRKFSLLTKAFLRHEKRIEALEAKLAPTVCASCGEATGHKLSCPQFRISPTPTPEAGVTKAGPYTFSKVDGALSRTKPAPTEAEAVCECGHPRHYHAAHGGADCFFGAGNPARSCPCVAFKPREESKILKVERKPGIPIPESMLGPTSRLALGLEESKSGDAPPQGAGCSSGDILPSGPSARPEQTTGSVASPSSSNEQCPECARGVVELYLRDAAEEMEALLDVEVAARLLNESLASPLVRADPSLQMANLGGALAKLDALRAKASEVKPAPSDAKEGGDE
jgi:hypothetical protein